MKRTQTKILVDGNNALHECFPRHPRRFRRSEKSSMLLKVYATVLMIYRHIPTKLRSNILSFNSNSVLLFTWGQDSLKNREAS